MADNIPKSKARARLKAHYWGVLTSYSPVAKEYLNHKTLGFLSRFAFMTGGIGGAVWLAYRLLSISQEHKPISQRWAPHHTDIAFIDRTRLDESDCHLYRFALPNAYDYTGHQPVSSVELFFSGGRLGSWRWLRPTRRFLTPISHPDQRGVIEFAVKTHNPGFVSQQLLGKLQPGDKITLGRWMKETPYVANAHPEVGFICGNSGITPLLQILQTALGNPDDTTMIRCLYGNKTPERIPFREHLLQLQADHPDRFKIDFVVEAKGRYLSHIDTQVCKLERASKIIAEKGVKRTQPVSEGVRGTRKVYSSFEYVDGTDREVTRIDNERFTGYLGQIDANLIMETMPPPGEGNKVLICGSAKMINNMSGRTLPVVHATYVQGFYHGILKELGYARGEVYKFGSTISLQGLMD
jgi:ferredoxin-NADP reductase